MIDLDAVIAAEVTGDPIEVTVGGQKYLLRSEMPWDTAVLIGKQQVDQAVAALVIDPQDAAEFAAAFLAGKPSYAEITRRLNALYATGESEASRRSSTNGGRRSRPTSNGSTNSTSAAP